MRQLSFADQHCIKCTKGCWWVLLTFGCSLGEHYMAESHAETYKLRFAICGDASYSQLHCTLHRCFFASYSQFCCANGLLQLLFWNTLSFQAKQSLLVFTKQPRHVYWPKNAWKYKWQMQIVQNTLCARFWNLLDDWTCIKSWLDRPSGTFFCCEQDHQKRPVIVVV